MPSIWDYLSGQTTVLPPQFPQQPQTPSANAFTSALAADPTLGQTMSGFGPYVGHLLQPVINRVFGPQSPGSQMQVAYQSGFIPTTEQQVPWAVNQALASTTRGTPFSRPSALGSAGGRMIQPTIEETAAKTALPEGYTVNDILHPDFPAAAPRSRNVEDIARDLHDRGSKALTDMGVEGGKLTGPSEHDPKIANAIADEVQGAMNREGNAGDWYTNKVQEAQNVASLLHPEIATNPNMRSVWNAALATTSQGETVPSNTRLANYVMQYFRENGRFPTDIKAKQQGSINGNFNKLNDLIDAGGLDHMREFLDTEFSVRDLKKMGYKIGDENMDTMVRGSAILGPKIGGGFYQNLNGNYDPVTMDMHFMRGWGRLTGTLVGRPPEAPISRFADALRAAGQDVPEGNAAMLAKANDLVAQHERDFRTNRALYDSGDKSKSELTYSAERVQKALQGINEQPLSGGHRAWIRDVWNQARGILAARGQNVTNADMQALWWYPEKDLYAKLGGVPSEGINVDYSTALQDAARKAGVSEDAIAQALSASHRGPGPATAGNVARGQQGGGAQVGGASAPAQRRSAQAPGQASPLILQQLPPVLP